MFLMLAYVAGTGKSLLVDVISTIARGRLCPVIATSRSKEEMDKQLGSLLLEGPPMISLDNLTHDLESELLCQITERKLIKTRILGKSETPECEWRGTIFATGNNITLVKDLTRRGLICNQDAGIEQPESRTFKYNPIERVLAERGRYIAAGIIIARAYLASGQRVKCTPFGSYESWCRYVREPLAWLGEPDPVKSVEQARANDPARMAAQALIEMWEQHIGIKDEPKVNDIIQRACEQRPSSDLGMDFGTEFVRPEFRDLLLEHCCTTRGNTVDPRRLGSWLKEIQGQVHLGHKILPTKKSTGHGNRWRLLKA
jgi:hypothetical protein